MSPLHPFAGWERVGQKVGGYHQEDDPNIGRYKNSDDMTQQSLFKRESEEQKMVAEVFVGNFLYALIPDMVEDKAISPSHVNQAKKNVAEVKMVRADNNNKLYIQSIFIERMREDLWQAAYREWYEKKIETANAAGDVNKATNLQAELVEKLKKRPSAVFNMEVRRVVEEYLENHSELVQELCDQIALRIYMGGDFGVHHGNFGVRVEAPLNGGEPRLHCCMFDYGAGLVNLRPDVDIFFRNKTGLALTQLHKHHFLEYGSFVFSDSMARALIKVGSIPDDNVVDAITHAAENLRPLKLDYKTLQRTCQRAGMKPKTYKNVKDADQLISLLRDFTIERDLLRKKSAKQRGYGLLLVNCINEKGEVNTAMFKQHLKTYPDLYKYILTDFKKSALVKYPLNSWGIKNKIIQAAIENRPVAERLPEYRRLINYYKAKASSAVYSADNKSEMSEVKEACVRLRENLENAREEAERHSVNAELEGAIKSLDEISSFMRDANAQDVTKEIAHYSNEAVVLEGADIEQQINDQVRSFFNRGTGLSIAHVAQPTGGNALTVTEDFSKSTQARVTYTQVETKSRFGQSSMVQVATVQRVRDDGSFSSKMNIKTQKQGKKLDDETCRMLALELIKSHLAGENNKSQGIYLDSKPERIRNYIVAYCAFKQNQQEAAIKAGMLVDPKINYQCFDRAKPEQKLIANPKDVNYLSKRLLDPQDPLARMFKEANVSPELISTVPKQRSS